MTDLMIHYCSDLHLEFGALPLSLLPKKGDTLILGGDISLTACLEDYDKRWRTYDNLRHVTDEFIHECCKRFKRVFWYPGNHEAYNGDYAKFYNLVRLAYEKYDNLHASFNGSFSLNDNVQLLFGTLWTDLDGGRAYPQLNDYRLVMNGAAPLSYTDTRNLHHETREFFDKEISKHPSKQFVVATHHCPDERCLNSERYALDGSTEYGYYTDMTDWVLARPQISHWICGHTHKRTNFSIGKTKVLMNCRGYVHEYGSENFRLRSFKIKEKVDAGSTV